MSEFIKAYQGRSFEVVLQSMLGSTNYGWCLKTLPNGLVLAGQSVQPLQEGIGPVNQIFYFLAEYKTVEVYNVELEFGLYCLATAKLEKTVKVNVQIVPANSVEDSTSPFLKYSENKVEFSMGNNLLANLLYGYPCSEANVKYGYPCSEANVKYGYPCSEANVKYGYPCSEANVKYGYPCSEANVKYGYPCSEANVKYGYPCSEANVKYGYPCSEANVKYGYPCDNMERANCVHKYGFPTCE